LTTAKKGRGGKKKGGTIIGRVGSGGNWSERKTGEEWEEEAGGLMKELPFNPIR